MSTIVVAYIFLESGVQQRNCVHTHVLVCAHSRVTMIDIATDFSLKFSQLVS